MRDPGSAQDTDWDTREFAALGLERNLTFFQHKPSWRVPLADPLAARPARWRRGSCAPTQDWGCRTAP